MIEHIAVGAVAFASTNVDDILLLAVFFGQRGRRVESIVVGQVLGIAALVAASVVAALAAVMVPPRWLALLGILPLALGIRQLWQRQGEDPGDESRPAGIFAVASVTIANGADNLGIYIPLFAAQAEAIPIYVLIFAVGTAVWCAAGYALVRHPAVRAVLERSGHRIMPWVFIGIGGYVLSDWWRGQA